MHNPTLLGALGIAISLGGFYATLRLNQTRLEQLQHNPRPGWYAGLIMSRLPLGVARVILLAISRGILAAAIVEISGG